MANPSRAELDTMIANMVKLIDECRRYGNITATNNIISMLDTLDQSLELDFVDEATLAAQAIRSAVASTITPSQIADCLRPFLKQYMRSVVGRTNLSSDSAMLGELYRYFADNALRVQSMAFTFGAPVATAGIIGNGQIIRLTKDERNYDIESGYIDSKRARCIADYQTGTARGEEIFLIEGQVSARDELQRSGSGQQGTLVCASADRSLVNNPTWTGFGGTVAAPTSLTSWTSDVTVNDTNYAMEDSSAGGNIFRLAPSDGSTGYALRIKQSALLTQKLSVRGTKVARNRPYLMAVAWNRVPGAASGTLLCRMGSAFTSVSVAAQTGWNVTLVPSARTEAHWYRYFGEDDMDIGIQWTRTAGDLIVDDILFLEGTFFDNHWYWALPASASSWIPHRAGVGEEFTWADQATGAKVQRMISRGFPGAYLPHSIGSGITLTDPA